MEGVDDQIEFFDDVQYPSDTRCNANTFHTQNELVQVSFKCVKVLVQMHEGPRSNA